MDVVKGRTATLVYTFYSYWSGETSTSTLANITGATIKFMAKLSDSDLDSAATISKTGSVTDGLNGLASVTLAASDTNSISQRQLMCECVAKLADGTTYIGAGVDTLNLKANLIKTLF